MVVNAATVLQMLVDQMLPEETASHPAGFADRSGWAAMACNDLLVHGIDIAATVGVTFQPDLELVGRVMRRLFPWMPTSLRHSNG